MSGEERGDDKREKRRTVSKRLHAFPGGSVVKNLPANEGDMGSVPDLGKIPHATEQLIPCSIPIELVL